jgi:hypothetical protein
MQFKNILMMLTCIVVSISTFAQPNQKARVKQGIRSGEITGPEAQRIRKEQLDVKDARVDARQDGVVTPHERNQIRKEKKQASRTIYRKKHNARDRN